MAPSKTAAPANASAANVLSSVVNSYIDKTPQRTKLIDAFLGFLVLTGVLQFVYCVVAGNYVRLA
jgi:oligosaccharyltransferase complex subunit epsilon